MPNCYKLPVTTPDELFKVISRTTTGRTLLAEFLPKFSNQTVKIENYPAVLRAEIRKFIPPAHPIGACLQGERIFLDYAGARGVVAAYLVHEIACYLFATGQSNLCREKMEAKALKLQAQFTTELRERDPEYECFIRAYRAQAVELNQILEFEAA